MSEKFTNLIGGRRVPARSGRTFKNLNPATGEVLGEFPASGPEDVNDAVEAAANAYQGWRLTPAPKRAEIVFRAGEIIRARKEDLARAMTREMGKVLAETRGDVQEGIDMAYLAAGEGRRMYGVTTPSEMPNKWAMSVRCPIGVVGVITPWNFPFAIPSWKLMPALVAGNTAVFKPAGDTPEMAWHFTRIFEEAGLPPGVLNLVFGSGSEVGNPMVEHPGVHVVSFTGSTDVGLQIAGRGGALGKRISLEMGGKNAIIVMDDADLGLATDATVHLAVESDGAHAYTLPVHLVMADGNVVDAEIAITPGPTEHELAVPGRPLLVEIDPDWTMTREIASGLEGDVTFDGEVDGDEAVFDHGEDQGCRSQFEVGGELREVGVSDDHVEAAVLFRVGVWFVACVDDGALQCCFQAYLDLEVVGSLAELEAVFVAVLADADAAGSGEDLAGDEEGREVAHDVREGGFPLHQVVLVRAVGGAFVVGVVLVEVAGLGAGELGGSFGGFGHDALAGFVPEDGVAGVGDFGGAVFGVCVVDVQPGTVGQDHVGQADVLVGELAGVGGLACEVEAAGVPQRVFLLEVPAGAARPVHRRRVGVDDLG